MNNWRLLLLALVAVFQPITSFTDRNLVDGRQQCCDRQTDTLLRDSRPSLYGTDVIAKASSPLRRLNARDESREDRQLRQRVTALNRHPTERSLLNIRERDIEQRPSILSRSTHITYRGSRVSPSYNDERQLDGQRRERNALTRVSMMQRKVRSDELTSRNALSRDEILINFNNERQERENFQQVRMPIQHSNLHRMTLTRDTRNNLRMIREDAQRARVAVGRNSPRLARERVNVLSHQTLSGNDVRHSNNERRDAERFTEQRRSFSENSRIVERVRDMRVRVSSREERQESRERFMTERTVENRKQNDDHRESREQIRENTERRQSRERMYMDRRDVRDSRLMNDRNVRDRDVENRQTTRQSERQSRRDNQFIPESREESSASRRVVESRTRVAQRTRSEDSQSFSNTRAVSKSNRSTESLVRESDVTRKDTAPRDSVAIRERDNLAYLFRNIKSVRARDNSIMINKIETESEPIGNWQCILYTVQAAYLLGLIIQALRPIQSEKSKWMNLRWWPSSSQKAIKMD